jgi:hypothetical protein
MGSDLAGDSLISARVKSGDTVEVDVRAIDEDAARAVVEAASRVSECPACEGAGYDIGHEAQCYEGLGCQCSGEQVLCSACEGSGETELVAFEICSVELDASEHSIEF